MKPPFKLRLWPFIALLAAVVSVQAALVAGGFVFSKRIETLLRAEPRMLANVSGKTVGYGKKLTISEVQGAWLKVGEADNSGWVFKGNIAELPPEKIKGIDVIPLEASKTTATDANRPLTPEAAEYASRRNMAGAGKDIDWMLTQCSAIKDPQVEDYLKTHQKGEYQ